MRITHEITATDEANLRGAVLLWRANPALKRTRLEFDAPTAAVLDDLAAQFGYSHPAVPAVVTAQYPVDALTLDDKRFLSMWQSYHPGTEWALSILSGDIALIRNAINEGALYAPGFDMSAYKGPLLPYVLALLR